MKLDENLVAVHAYLCADGYVIRNLSYKKPKYYRIGFRNTNLILLKDFQGKFYKYFNFRPSLYPNERCQIGSKDIYFELTKNFGSFYSDNWSLPKINSKLVKIWLRAFFDCEGWVFCKKHQNRHIGIDSINEKGLNQIKKELEKLKINVIKKTPKNRNIFRILIYGKNNLEKFRNEIGFLHPEKKEKLEKVLLDFVDYHWILEKNRNSIREIMLKRAVIKKPYYVRIFSREKSNLEKLKKYLNMLFYIGSNSIKIREQFNGLGTRYFELNINKKVEVENLARHSLINNQELNKIDQTKLKC